VALVITGVSQSLALHESRTIHVRNTQQYISKFNDGTLDIFMASLIKRKKRSIEAES